MHGKLTRRWRLLVIASASATHFSGIVMQEWDCRCSHYMVAKFPMLDVTVSCEPLSRSTASRQLLHCLALTLRIELKRVLGLKFTRTGLSWVHSWVDYNLELNSGCLQRDERQWVVNYMAANGDPVGLLGGNITIWLWSFMRMLHGWAAKSTREALVILDEASYCGLVWPVWFLRIPEYLKTTTDVVS